VNMLSEHGEVGLAFSENGLNFLITSGSHTPVMACFRS
jgi:hypothetical protein